MIMKMAANSLGQRKATLWIKTGVEITMKVRKSFSGIASFRLLKPATNSDTTGMRIACTAIPINR